MLWYYRKSCWHLFVVVVVIQQLLDKSDKEPHLHFPSKLIFCFSDLEGKRNKTGNNNYFAFFFFLKGCLYLYQIFITVYIWYVSLPPKWIHMKIHILCTSLFSCVFLHLLFVMQIILPPGMFQATLFLELLVFLIQYIQVQNSS